MQFTLAMTSPSSSLPSWIYHDDANDLIIVIDPIISDAGIYTFQLDATTTGIGSVTTFQTFSIELIDPCLSAQINPVD